MHKTSLVFVALLIVYGCLGFQNHALAQNEEQSDRQAVLEPQEQGDGQPSSLIPNSAPKARLSVELNPTIIDDVVFEGLQAIPESDVVKTFRDLRVGIGKKYPFSAADFGKAVNVLKDLLDECGYLDATVEVSIQDITAYSKLVKLTVSEGVRYLIKGIRFEGNTVFSNEELRSQLKLVNQSGQEALDRPLFEYDLNNVRNFMRSRGFLRARILEPRYLSGEGEVRITVPVKEGPLSRIGEISVLGSRRFSSEQIVEIIGLKKGDIADGRRIGDVLHEELMNLYGNMGYPQYSYELEPKFKDNPNLVGEGIVDLEILIVEGACYKIGWIEFQGHEKLTEQQLLRLLFFKVGDTYNEQLIRDSIRNLSESELLRSVNRNANVEYQFNEESHLVAIIISVMESLDE